MYCEELDDKNGFEIVEEYMNRAIQLMMQSGYSNSFALNLVKAADHFIVDRRSTGLKTILAGFPWFADWGRDTMIAFEGLTLCTKRFDDAREILESFAKYVKNGLVPNVFPDKGSDPSTILQMLLLVYTCCLPVLSILAQRKTIPL